MRKLIGIFVIFFSLNQLVYAVPVTIDFEGFSVSTGFVGGVEDGVSITAVGSGEATSPQGSGNPGIGISAGGNQSNPIYQFEMLNSQPFKFTSLDFAPFFKGFNGLPNLTVQGFNNSTLVGTDVFSVPFEYQTFSSINLAGIDIDVLLLDFGITSFVPTIVDNVVLNVPVPSPSVPAPTAVLLITLGLIGMRKNLRGKLSLAIK